VKPTKLVKGQRLAKLMAKENCSFLDINCMGSNSGGEQTEEAAEEQEQNQPLVENLATCEWYSSVFHFLQKLEVPPGLSSSQALTIKLKSSPDHLAQVKLQPLSPKHWFWSVLGLPIVYFRPPKGFPLVIVLIGGRPLTKT